MPVPPIPGTARFENDIATCSSVVGHKGSRKGTVPCRPIANPMLDAKENTNARSNQAQLA